MVGGGKVLDVQPADAPGGQDHRSGLHRHQLARLQVKENRLGASSLFIQEKVHRRRELQTGDAAVYKLVPEDPHQLHPGQILAGKHPLAGVPPAMVQFEDASVLVVEHHPQAHQPAGHLRPVHDQGFHQIGHIGVMPAADSVQVVQVWAVPGVYRRAHPPLGHDRVGVSHPQLGGQEHLHPAFPGGESGGRPGPAAADDQDIGSVIGPFQAQLVRIADAVCFHHPGKLHRHLFPPVRSQIQGTHPLGAIVGVICGDQPHPLTVAQARNILGATERAGRLQLLQRRLKMA